MEKKKYVNPSIDIIDMAVIQTNEVVGTSGGEPFSGDPVVGGST